MLLLIICIILIAISLPIIIWDLKTYRRPECIAVSSLVVCGVSVLLVFIFGLMSLRVAIEYDANYQEMLTEREILSAALENSHSDQITNIAYLYEDIIEFNKKLQSHKRWADNIWVGLMYNDKIATLDYIEIPRVDVS